MPDIERPTGTAATEVMGESWPVWSESNYFAKAQQCLAKAAQEQKAAQTATHSATYTDQEADGKAFNQIASELHIKAHAATVNSEKFAALAGWATHMGELIKATKEKISAEVKAHESKCISGKSLTSTADVMKESGDVAEHKGNVTAAMATLETDLTSIETSLSADVIPAPPGGVPKIPDDFDPGALPGGMPATDPTAASGTPSVGSAGSGAPSASAAGAGGAPSGAPARPLPASAFAAPPAPATSPAAAATSPAGATPAAAEAPAGGMPMSGMPMGGMPQMSPPQMPASGGGQTPGADVAKTVGDTISKVAGKDGTPVSADTLSKLLDAQGGGSDGHGDGGDGKKTDHDKLPEGAADPLAKVFGNNGQQTHLLDPYSAANQSPSLNNPASPAHLQSPSPAAPVVTAAPASPTGLPMTQLSADENSVTPQQHSTATASTSDAVTTHPSAGGPAATSAASAAPGAPGAPAVPGGSQPSGSLGAYNGAALGAPAPMPMAPMGAPMGGMMAPPAAGGGAATPVLAAAVPAAVVEAATSGRRRAPEATRVTSLPPEHAAAEQHLAGLARVFTQRGWATAVLAIACLEGQAGVRYVLATADGLSLVPMGVPLPGGVELLAEQHLSPSFAADWSGRIHPARKLAAWAGEHPAAGRLVYLVSNDQAGVPAVSGAVVEVRQTQAERTALGGGSPATLPRTALATTVIPVAKAADALQAFGAAWGITDATTEDWRTAPGRLWAARWDRDRPDDYPAVIATYHYVEGLEALAQGREADAAYSASALAAVRPYDWVAA